MKQTGDKKNKARNVQNNMWVLSTQKYSTSREDLRKAQIEKAKSDYKKRLLSVLQHEDNIDLSEAEADSLRNNAKPTGTLPTDTIQQPTINQPVIESQNTDGSNSGKSVDQYPNKPEVKLPAGVNDYFKTIFDLARASLDNVVTSATSVRRSNPESREKRDLHFLSRVLEGAKEFDDQILKLQLEKQKLEKGMENAARYDRGAAAVYYSSQIEKIDEKISDLEKQKKDYVFALTSASNTNLILKNSVRGFIMQSDEYKEAELSANEARTQAILSKSEYDKDAKLPYSRYFMQGERTAKYKNAIRKATIKDGWKQYIDSEYDRLLSYIEDLGYLPHRNEIPENLRDIADRAFTRDGKNVLEDKEFRDNINSRLIMNDDIFDIVSKSIKDAVKNPSPIDETMVNDARERLTLLRDMNKLLRYDENGNRVKLTPVQEANIQAQERGFEVADRILDKAIKHKELGESIMANYKSDNFVNDAANTGHAFVEFLTDPNTYLFDAYNLKELGELQRASRKLDSDQPLSKAEEEVLLAKFIEDIYHSTYKAYEDVNAYKWGKTAAESLKFMAEFLATLGMSSVIRKGILTGTKKAIANVIKNIAKKEVAKFGRNVAKNKLLNVASHVVSDAAYAAALENTLGMPRVIKEAAEQSVGQLSGRIDSFGNPIVQDVTNTTDFGKALLTSETRNWIENFSEMMGEWHSPIIKFGAGYARKIPTVGKFLDTIEKGFTNDMLRDAKQMAETYMRYGLIEQNKIFGKYGLRNLIPSVRSIFNKRALKAAQFHGMPGEIAEEYYGLVLQHAFGVQDYKDRGLLEDAWEQSADIWGGIAISTGLLGALGSFGSIRSLVKYDSAVKNLANAFGSDASAEIQRAMTFASPSAVMSQYFALAAKYGSRLNINEHGKIELKERDAAEKWQSFKNHGQVSKDAALAEYTKALLELRGSIYGEDVMKRMIGDFDYDLQQRAKLNGYSRGTYNNLEIARSVANTLRAELQQAEQQATGAEQDSLTVPPPVIADFYDNNAKDIHEAIDFVKNTSKYANLSEKQRKDLLSKLVAYHNAVQFALGANMRLSDLLETRKLQGDRIVDLITHRDGSIYRIFAPKQSDDTEHKYTGPQTLFVVDDSSLVLANEKTGVSLIPATNEINTAPGFYKTTGDVLVADGFGNMSYMPIENLKGWTFDNSIWDPSILKREKRKQIDHDDLLESISAKRELAQVRTGEQIHFGNQVLTILDVRDGITYSISDPDGLDAKIYHTNDINQLKAVIQKQKEQQDSEITQLFKDDADRIVGEIIRNRAVEENKLLLKKFAGPDYQYVDDTIDTEQLMLEKQYLEESGESAEEQPSDEVQEIDAAPTEVPSEEPEGILPEPESGQEPEPKPLLPDNKAPEGPEPGQEPEEDDNLLNDVIDYVRKKGYASHAQIRKAFSVDLERASKIMDQLAAKGVLGTKGKFGKWSVKYGSIGQQGELPKIGPAQGAPLAPIVLGNADQNAAYQTLLDDIKASQESKKGTSGYHYLIERDGKLRLYRRGHSVNIDMYYGTDDTKMQQARADEYKPRLHDAWNGDSREERIESLKKEIDKIVDERAAQYLEFYEENGYVDPEFRKDLAIRELTFSINWDMYKTFLTNKDVAITSEVFDEVITGLSEILARKLPGPSVIRGNIYDTILRVLIDAEDIDSVQYENEELTIYYYGKKTHISEVLENTHRSTDSTKFQLVTREAFEAIKQRVKVIRDYYEKPVEEGGLGWKLCTKPYTLSAKLLVDGKEMYVAGEIDCAAIDVNGNCHLIDFKTYSPTKNYEQVDDGEYVTPSQLFDIPVDTDADGNNIYTFSLGAQYAMQMYLYKLLRVANGSSFVDSQLLLIGAQTANESNGVIYITEKNVENSKILTTKNGRLVPNVQQLDDYPFFSNDANFIAQLKQRMKVASQNELDKALSLLASSDNIIDGLGEEAQQEFATEVEEVNRITRELLSQSGFDNLSQIETDAKSQLIYKHIDAINDLKKRIHAFVEIRESFRTLGANLPLRFKNVDFSLAKTIDDFVDIANGAFSEYYVKWCDRLNVDPNTIDQDFLTELMYDLLKANLVVRYLQQHPANLTSNKQIAYVINQITKHTQNHVIPKIFSPCGVADEFLSLLNGQWLEKIDPMFDEAVDEKKEWYEYNQLSNDMKSAGDKVITKSVSTSGRKLTDALKDQSFVDDALFYIQQNQDYTDGVLFEMVIVYNGEEYSPVVVNIAHTFENGKYEHTKEGAAFNNALYTQIVEKGAKRVRIKNENINRTFGLFLHSDEMRVVDTERWLLTPVEEIRYGFAYDNFGITRTVVENGKISIAVTKPGDAEFARRKIMYVYSGHNTQSNPASGVLVMMYNPGFTEKVDRGMKVPQIYVPVNIYSQRFDFGTASLIADILKGKYVEGYDPEKDGRRTFNDILNEKFTQDGITYDFTNQELINTFISYGKHNQKGNKEHIHLYGDNKGVHVVGRVSGVSEVGENGELQIIDEPYDLYTEEGYNAFVKFLQQQINLGVYDDFMEGDFAESPIGRAISKMFSDKRLSTDKVVKFGSSSYTVTIDDVKTTKGKRISGLAWYLKTGRLKTDFRGLSHPLLSITEEGAIDDKLPPDSQPIIETGPVVGTSIEGDGTWLPLKTSSEDDSLSSRFAAFSIQAEPAPEGLLIVEEEARKNIRDIAGDVAVPGFEDDVLEVLHNARVVGACYANMIRLSRLARRGTEYHEAFHYVLELLVSEKTRNRAYAKYRKRFGEELTDLQIAEKAADEFWEFKDVQNGKYKWRDLFGLLPWYRFFKKVGSLRLLFLYMNAASGRYKNNKVRPESLERWKRLTAENGGFLASAYEVNGFGHNHVLNQKDYDATVDCIRSIAYDRRTYEKAGIKGVFSVTAGSIKDIELTPEMIINSPQGDDILRDPKLGIPKEAREKFLEVLGYCVRNSKITKIDDRGKLVLALIEREITKNFEREATNEAGVLKRKEKGKKQKENSKIKQKKLSDDDLTMDNDEWERTEQREFGEYSTPEFEKDSSTKASARVKMFFSVLPDILFKEVPVIDPKTKKPTTRLVEVYKLNAANLPQMMPFKTAWSIIVNTLFYCRDFQQMQLKLKYLSDKSVIYGMLYKRFVTLLKRAYGNDYRFDANGKVIVPSKEDPEKFVEATVLDNSAEGILSEICSCTCLAKTIPNVTQSMQNTKNGEEAQSIRILSGDLEYFINNVCRDWSALLVSGETKYVGKHENGTLFFKKHRVGDKMVSYNQQTLVEVAKWFSLVFNLLSSVNSLLKNLPNISVTITAIDPETKQQVVSTKTGEDILSSDVYLRELCKQLIQNLNDIGIGFTMEDLDFLLEEDCVSYKPGDRNDLRTKLLRFADKNIDAVKGTSFYDAVAKTIGGLNNPKNAEAMRTLWSNYRGNWKPFIRELSQARYHRLETQHMLNFLTIAGKKQYALSEHNRITDGLAEYNDPDCLKTDMKFRDLYYLYNADETGEVRGSRVFKYFYNTLYDNSGLLKVWFHNAPGLKTDSPGSEGVEYLDLSELEDVILKYGLLAANDIILPTLADKTTYGSLHFGKGFDAFGIDWTKAIGKDHDGLTTARAFLGKDNYVPTIKNGRLYLKFNDAILDQFIEYATCEYKAAKHELERIKAKRGTNEVGIDNFHGCEQKVKLYRGTDNKGKPVYEEVSVNVILGARLSTFTGIYVIENGEYKYKDFNSIVTEDGMSIRTEEDCLKDAEDLFFNVGNEQTRTEILREIMRMLLSAKVLKNLDYLTRIGLITFDDVSGLYKNATGKDGASKGLDKSKLHKMQWFMSSTANAENTDSKPSYQDKGFVHHNALVAYVADMTCKEQMSHQECFRMYSGNLACYKWKYNSQGLLTDCTQDFFKRIGSLVSTGAHNVPNLPGIGDKVVCAEMFDEKISSPFSETFVKAAITQELLQNLIRVLCENHTAVIDGETVVDPIVIDNMRKYKDDLADITRKAKSYKTDDELKTALIEAIAKTTINDPSNKAHTLQEAQINANEAASKIVEHILQTVDEKYVALGGYGKKKVDVNDGATYISDECCEKLLRAVGSWDDNVAEAFAVLRGALKVVESSKGVKSKITSNDDILKIAAAYSTVLTTVIGTLKYTAFGQRFYEYDGHVTSVTYLDKTAFFPMFDCMATGHLRAVHKIMKRDGIDILKARSAIKEGGVGAVQLDSETFKQWDNDPNAWKAFKFNTYELSFDELRKQFNTDPKGKEFMPLGTQYQKVVLDLITADTVIDVDGKELDALAIRDQIMDCYKQISLAGKTKHDSKYYHDDKTLNVKAFAEMLQKQLEDKDASDPVRYALSLEDYYTVDKSTGKTVKRKRFKLPIAAMSSGSWILSIVTSVINKELIDVNGPGAAFYQRSAWASEGRMSDALAKVVTQDSWQLEINHGAPLQEINEQGSMDIVLSIDFFDYLFKQHPALNGQSFYTKKEWLIKNGIISGFVEDGSLFPPEELEEIDGKLWHHAKTNVVGYRIPTQAVSSIHAMRCVDVLPVVRDTVMLPKEVTAVTGSDFDIDKFFLSTKYYQEIIESGSQEQIDAIVQEFGFKDEQAMLDAFNEAKAKRDSDEELTQEDIDLIKKINNSKYEELKRTGTRLTDKFDDKTDQKKHYYNKLIETQIQLLQTYKNNIAKLHGSIDADTEPLKEIRNELEERNPSVRIEAFDLTSLQTNVTAKMSFAIGKKGIGPYALNNNNHVFTVLYNVKFVHEEGGILDVLNLESLATRSDRNGHPILSWISGLINAHVDVAKDPYIRSLGVNQYTYNLVSLLIRTGYGRETFWFTTQPVMRRLYSAYDRASGVYSQNETLSTYSRLTKAISDETCNYVKEVTGTVAYGTNSAIDAINDYLKKNYGYEIMLFIETLLKYEKGVSVMRQMSIMTNEEFEENPVLDIGMPDGALVKAKDLQLVILAANHKLLSKALDLSLLVQHTKIDTKKQGKTVIEQYAYQKAFEKLISMEKSPFEYNSITNMVSNSFIEDKTMLAINAEKDLLKTQVLEATDGYLSLVDLILTALNADRTDQQFMKIVAKMIDAKIKADYFFRGADQYCLKRNLNVDKIMSGSSSVFAQLLKIKNNISNLDDHTYDSIRGTDGKLNNYLLNALITHVMLDSQSLGDGVITSQEQKAGDEWRGAQFVKSQNFSEDNIKLGDMQNAWRDLLNSPNLDLQRFAEQLIVYAFVTSANTGGGYDLFKYVPPQWMTGECDIPLKEEDTFAYYMRDVLEKLLDDSTTPLWSLDEIEELISNFAYEDSIVKTQTPDRVNSFIKWGITSAANPLYFAAIHGIDTKNPTLPYGENSWPGFIKIPSKNRGLRGQRAFDIYRLLAVGRHVSSDGTSVVDYPIYSIVPPHGGKYPEGQKIFSIGLQNVTNKKADFRKRWEPSLPQISGIDLSKFKNPVEVFEELLYIRSNFENVRDVSKFDKQFIDQNFPFIVNGKMSSEILVMLQDVQLYNDAKDIILDDYNTRIANRQLGKNTKEQVDYNSASTELHLERIAPDDIREEGDPEKVPTKKSRYQPVDLKDHQILLDILTIFGDDVFDKINQSGLHFEIYKKHSETEDGRGYYNYTITASIKRANRKGWVEINANVDLETLETNGEFSIHFKTYSPKMGKDTKNASVPLNKKNKIALVRAILNIFPESIGEKNTYVLSTYGTLSPGGVHIMQNLIDYCGTNVNGDGIDIYIKKRPNESRTVKTKDGEYVEIPIYEKDSKLKKLYDSGQQDVLKSDNFDLPTFETSTEYNLGKSASYSDLQAVVKTAAHNCKGSFAEKGAYVLSMIKNNPLLKEAFLNTSNQPLKGMTEYPLVDSYLEEHRDELVLYPDSEQTSISCGIL